MPSDTRVFTSDFYEDSTDTEARRSYYMRWPRHLAEAGERDALNALLLDPDWLVKKLEAVAEPMALADDYELAAAGEGGEMQSLTAHALIAHALRLSAPIIARDRRQLLPQLLGRLMGADNPTISRFVEAIRRRIKPPALVSVFPSLTPSGGAELARLGSRNTSGAPCVSCPTDALPQAPGTKPSNCGIPPPEPNSPASKLTPTSSASQPSPPTTAL